MLIITGVVTLGLTGRGEKKANLDTRFTLRRQDKIPYGTWIAYRQLPQLFPQARILTERKKPGDWDSLDTDKPGQGLIIINDRFQAGETELEALKSFAERGNEIWISAREISAETEQFFDCEAVSFEPLIQEALQGKADSLRLRLIDDTGHYSPSFTYPGRPFDAYFSRFDSNRTRVHGVQGRNLPVLLEYRTGQGKIFLHLAPAAYTNYFLLQDNNLAYYEQSLSLLSPTLEKLVWDEYFLNRRGKGGSSENKNWFTVLMNLQNADREKPFRPAFWLLIALALLYVLLEMRRKQRPIPVHRPPSNESVDFVKTIGRLYYEKADHRNLCQKMAQYFLEHVRQRYKLPPGRPGDAFSESLHLKSGADRELVQRIVGFIGALETADAVNPDQLIRFHQDLELFYQHT